MGSKDKTKKIRGKNKEKEGESNLFESDETFAFIAGYTSGGFAYGITWEEMEAIERRDKEFLGEEYRDYNDQGNDFG